MTKVRYPEISFLSVLFCLMVVFIHASAQAVTQLPKYSTGYVAVFPVWRICGCAVTGFIFLSGLKFSLNHGTSFNYPKFLKRRLSSILLPYLIYSAFYYIYGVIDSGEPFVLPDLIIGTLTGDCAGHLYFIVALVQFYLLAPVWRFVCKSLDSKLAVLISCLITVFLGFLLPVFCP